MSEAIAARCRDETRPAALWHQTGAIAEATTALLALPAPGVRSAPRLARIEPSELWLPGRGGST